MRDALSDLSECPRSRAVRDKSARLWIDSINDAHRSTIPGLQIWVKLIRPVNAVDGFLYVPQAN